MGSRPEGGKARYIDKWLEGVSMETSEQTQDGKGTNLPQPEHKVSPHLSLQHQHYSSNIPLPRSPIMVPPVLRERKPKSPPPGEPPPPKKTHATAGHGKRPLLPAPQSTSVHSTEPSESRAGSAYVTSRSHQSARKQRNDLSAAEPVVIFASLNDRHEEKPKEVRNLMGRLIDGIQNAVPPSLRPRLRAQQIGDYHAHRNDATLEETKLWDRADEVMRKANEALESDADESSWTQIATPLLESYVNSANGLFKTIPVQTVPIAPPSLIPTLFGQPFAFKKVDAAVVLVKSNPEVRQLYLTIKKRHPTLNLSQSDDPGISGFCQLAAIVIKSPDGSYYGASVELAIWLAAGLEKVRQLRDLATISTSASADLAYGVLGPDRGSSGALTPSSAPVDQSSVSTSSLLPYPGIAVVGQSWYLHLAVRSADGTVTIYGPQLIGDTTDQSGIFRIVAALGAIRLWGEEVYYPWLRDHILLPLSTSSSDMSATTATFGSASSGALGHDE